MLLEGRRIGFRYGHTPWIMRDFDIELRAGEIVGLTGPSGCGKPQETLLSSLGIQHQWLRRWPNELSGGELQRFCVARALGPQTRYLLADEMTTMLDAITQAQIWRVVLKAVEQRNLGVLVISHESQLIRRLCARVVNAPIAPFRS